MVMSEQRTDIVWLVFIAVVLLCCYLFTGCSFHVHLHLGGGKAAEPSALIEIGDFDDGMDER